MAARKKVPLPESMQNDNGNGTATATKPPTSITPESNILKDIPAGAERVNVTSTVKYEVPKPEQSKPVNRPLPFNHQLHNQKTTSDNPLLSFIEYWSDETEIDLYVMLTRLPDNALNPNEFARPCSAPTTFAPFPFNAASFMSDVVRLNGNSGGYFKAEMVDENMMSITGETLRRHAFANPLSASVSNGNEPKSEMTQILLFMQESEKRNQEFFKQLIEGNKQDKFGRIAETYFEKKLLDIDRPQSTGTGLDGLPEDEKTMLALIRNPAMTKAVAGKISESIGNMFDSPEKAGNAVNKATSTIDNIISGVMSSPELQGQLMTLLSKGADLIGFGISQFAQRRAQNAEPNKPRPRQNPNGTGTPGTTPGTSGVNPANNVHTGDVIDIEHEVIDADTDELTAEELAAENEIIQSEMFQAVLNYIDSDEPLTLDNPFMTQGRELAPAAFISSMATFKHSSFEMSVQIIEQHYPFVEDFLIGRQVDENADWDEEIGKRRRARLEEFHGLLKDYQL